jgi:hypothetical protein
MQKLLASAAVAAALAMSVPANASTITVLDAGVLHTTTTGDSEATFDGIQSATTYGNTAPVQGTFTENGATFSGGGILMLNPPPLSALGLYAEPSHDTTQYLTVTPNPGNNPAETITLSGVKTRFGLYWGSMDTYNAVDFYRAGNLVESWNGGQIAALVPPPGTTATGDQVGDQNNRYHLQRDRRGSRL